MSNLILNPSVRSAFSKDGAVVMHIQQGLMYSSNPVGGLILELLSQGGSIEEIVDRVCRECEIPHERDMVHREVEQYMKHLQGCDILREEKLPA